MSKFFPKLSYQEVSSKESPTNVIAEQSSEVIPAKLYTVNDGSLFTKSGPSLVHQQVHLPSRYLKPLHRVRRQPTQVRYG